MSIPSNMLQPSTRRPVMSQTLSTPAKMGFQTRVVVALLITALLPLMAAIALANTVIQRASSTAFQDEFGEHLERSLGVYADLANAMKTSMRHEGAAIAAQPALINAVTTDDGEALGRELNQAIESHSTLVSVALLAKAGDELAKSHRARLLDERIERAFTVQVPIADKRLELVFAADRRRLDEMEGAKRFADAWQVFADEYSGDLSSRSYIGTFAVLFVITLVLAVIVGILVVRPVIQRIHQLAEATRPVAEGDLTIRVQDDGKDEIAYLGYAFNRMLEQLGRSRARIDFLKRMGEWQQMARRLAHEIKNPLTPIQLAVEECHRRYDGDDAKFKNMLDTTKDIVIEEVESLRRLVSEFAAFARLPRAALGEGDLGGFLREQKPRLLREEIADDDDVELTIEIEEGELPVAIDRTMLYRVLVESGGQCQSKPPKPDHDSAKRSRSRRLRGRRLSCCRSRTTARGSHPSWALTVFDPYVTTKQEGSGLGLAIVKKIVIDHGGQIEVDEGPLGGARGFQHLAPSARLRGLVRSARS